ncbi:MAG: class I SAM-dependent methyltransferase [Planctomycetaceae bacterium]|nr:class I SAM-dependent methyltransferase [Planctomycetaceae bacterium]
MVTANIDRDWNHRYESGDLPWDSGIPSRELFRVLDEQSIPAGRALELGCGTGTNAIALAARGFQVTAVDCSPRALELARAKAAEAGVNVHWVQADVQRFGDALEPFEFVFDRGCYHCCRRVDLAGYRQTLDHITRPGSRLLILAGNANEQSAEGPPRVSEQEIRNEFGDPFRILGLREFRFQDRGGADGPLGWSILLDRIG